MVEGVWGVSTPAEAAEYAGFTPTTPPSLPEGMYIGTIHVTIMDLGGPFIIVDTFISYPDTKDRIDMILSQTNRPFGTGDGYLDVSVTIDGLSYVRNLSDDGERLSLSWSQDGYQYVLLGYLDDRITEAVLGDLASSVRQ